MSHHNTLATACQALLGAAALLGLGTWAEPAAACGGLFCSSLTPVEQTAERIVFAKNESTITAIIEVQYSGPADEFAWLIPLPGIPEIEVSDQLLLDVLDSRTQPQYFLDTDYGSCPIPLVPPNAPGVAPAAVTPGANSSVTVLDSRNVGPYKTVTLSANEDVSNPAQAVVEWLSKNGYDLGPIGAEPLEPYLAAGLNIVAFRLNKEQDVGAIRPIAVTYEGDTPSIPIRPTAVAAQEDMGVRVYLLGNSRARSSNYLDLELNEARINWTFPQNNYRALINEAADEAGAHGFVTEYAQPTTSLEGSIWTESDEARIAVFERDSKGWTDAELMMQVLLSYRQPAANTLRVFERSLTLPEGHTFEDFSQNPVNYILGAPDSDLFDSQLDREEFLLAVQEEIVTPRKDAEALLSDYPYITRLFTTLSPLEMTVDPQFEYEEGLPDVSNIHEAQLALQCGADGENAWTLTLPSGLVVEGSGTFSGVAASEQLAPLPANRKIFERGNPQPLVDNTALIIEEASQLFAISLITPSGELAVADGNGAAEQPSGKAEESSGAAEEPSRAAREADGSADAAGGCSTAPGRTSNSTMLWGLLGLMAMALGRSRVASRTRTRRAKRS